MFKDERGIDSQPTQQWLDRTSSEPQDLQWEAAVPGLTEAGDLPALDSSNGGSRDSAHGNRLEATVRDDIDHDRDFDGREARNPECSGDSRRGARRLREPQITGTRPSGRTITVSQILPGATFFACDDIVANGCCDDADRCQSGDIFVARLTAAGDGHDDIHRALARGVAGVVAERMIPTFGTPLCLVPESNWAMTRLTHAFAGDPAQRLRVIAITGTSGKTTTAWLAASVLSEAGLRTGVLSDLGCLDADATEPVMADLSRPDVLAAWLLRLVEGGCTHAIVEVSSRMLAAHALAGITCDTVVVTSLASAHLDIHGTPEAYRAVKSRILDCLAPEGCLIANSDDDRVRRLTRRQAASGRHGAVLSVGLTGVADVTATPLERSLFGQTFMVRAGGHIMPVAVSTPTASFVRDSLLAVAVGLRQRVLLERIVRGIEAAGSVSGRMERIDRGQDYAVFVDRPTSGHALVAALAGLRRLTRGRLVMLAEADIAGRLSADVRRGGRAGRQRAAETFCRRAARWTDDCLVVPGTLMDEAGNAADVMAYARIDRLLSSLKPNDCLLVLGAVASHDVNPTDTDPEAHPLPLAAVVEGWLELAHVPQPYDAARRAA
ncbi:MAG: hypothetical protein HQ464_03010 [Planctomycetes bacterium]|nr:hypothetical protein [Planctomycetota bacterium]